ncbi:MAG: chorismate pyruvate-lyase family protein [Pseudomonadales bacterium]
MVKPITKSDKKIKDLFLRLAALSDRGIESGEVSRAFKNLGDIPAFLRALLVTDGTITMALEAYFSEAIKINTLRQGIVTASQPLAALGVNIDDECFFREVELLGASTGHTYAHATSILNKNAINKDLFDQLVNEHVGIGVILRNVARGSFREVLDVSSGNVMVQSDLSRTYRVSINAVPAILITEEFDKATFREPDLR